MRLSIFVVLGTIAMVLPTFGGPTSYQWSPGSRPVRITASPAILPKGGLCRVELVPPKGGNESSYLSGYLGTILRADDDGVLLMVTGEQHTNVRMTPVLSRLPLVKKRFFSTGVGRVELEKAREQWIGVDDIGAVMLLNSGASDGSTEPSSEVK